ncbi:MAG: hypothetical protein K8R56_07015, partial [Candidatus Eisenbacteria bacterium]|nr:hypothetical protein [Candidatus Eisenbacteria bacterium]
MKLSPRFVALALTALLAVAVTGCAKKPVATTPVPPAPTTTQTPTPTPTPTPAPPAPEPVKPAVGASDLQTVYFEYDSFTLSDNARAALDANAKLMRENAGLEVSLDG